MHMVINGLVLEKIYNHSVVTFDVFDTLLIRDTTKPTDVFELANGKGFRYLRIVAEMLARKKSKKIEITLEEIYRFLPKYDHNLELKWEKKVCRANPAIKEIYDEAKRQGKRIFAISDMYLPKEFLKELLKDNGIEVEDIYVSSEYGICKYEGKLFEKFCADKGINPQDVLHIGDSLAADVEGASKAGIASVHIKKDSNKLSYTKVGTKNIELRGFVNHQISHIEDRCVRIGYEVLGPLLVSFCQWLSSAIKDYKFRKVFFLARDMRMPYEIYCKMYGNDKVGYLRISRASLHQAAQNPDNFRKYLSTHECNGDVAIIDTGWRGIMQRVIEHYAGLNVFDTKIGGLYMGVSPVFHFVNQSLKVGFCFTPSQKRQRESVLYATFLEALLSQSEPKVVGYLEDGNPVFDSVTKDLGKIALLQKGAMIFAEDWIEKGNDPIDKNDAYNTFCNFCDKPNKEDIRELGLSEFDDTEVSTLVRFKGYRRYLRHPKSWFEDLRLSAWKAAYFQKSFPHMGVLYRLYVWVDSRFLIYKDSKKLKNISIEELLKYY